MKKIIIIGIGIFVIALTFVAHLVANASDSQPDLIFSHKLHIKDVGVDCATCHAKAATSTSGKDDLLPDMQVCESCHDTKEMGCKSCHHSGDHPKALTELKSQLTSYLPKFNHAKHISQGMKCIDCHAPMQDKEEVAGIVLPKMSKCMTCHKTPEDVSECYKCHGQNDVLKPVTHNLLWKKNHGSFAESNAQNCAMCHRESFCTDCHKGENLMNQSHPADFLMTHPIAYMSRESNCIACHNSYQYCQECHTKVNYIKPADHTPDWPRLHQTEAKAQLDRCIVCHAQDDPTCIGCHTNR